MREKAMSNYCGNCGLPLDENNRCSLCDDISDSLDALEIDESAPLLEIRQQAAAAEAPRVEYTLPPAPPAPKKSRSNAVLLIVAIVLATCAVCLAVIAAFRFHWFGLGEESPDESPAVTETTAVTLPVITPLTEPAEETSEPTDSADATQADTAEETTEESGADAPQQTTSEDSNGILHFFEQLKSPFVHGIM